jgi:hypothetical protein
MQEVAASVPPPDIIAGHLQAVRAATNGSALGLNDEEVKLGLQYGHYLRNRFTVLKLSHMLGIVLA